MTLTPIDTLKTTQQTRGGKEGLKLLKDRIKANGVGCLWWGALATAAATFVGNCESGSGLYMCGLTYRPLVRDVQLFVGKAAPFAYIHPTAFRTSFLFGLD